MLWGVCALFDVRGFLDEPMRPAQVATVNRSGIPLLGSLWFVYQDGRFWFNSQQGSPLLIAAAAGRAVAVIVDAFNPPERILQIRVRGRGAVEPHDPARVARIYRRYLGSALSEWPLSFPERLTDPTWVLWSVSPDSGLAVDYSGFGGDELRWHRLSDCPLSL
jgi:hypothetical protein